MCLQFVLTARFRRLKAPYGSDLVYAFHRDVTVAVLAFVAAHPLLLWFTPSRGKVLARLDLLGQPAFPRFGFYAAVCLALLAAASFGRRRWRAAADREAGAAVRPRNHPARKISPRVG